LTGLTKKCLMFDGNKQLYAAILFQVLIFGVNGEISAQNQKSGDQEIQAALNKHGFENVAVYQDNADLIVTYENRIYRFEARAAAEVLRCVAGIDSVHAHFVLIPQKRRIPVAAILVDQHSAQSALDGWSIPSGTVVTMSVGPYWKKLQDSPQENPSAAKVDITVHPQFKAQFGNYVNTVESQVNLAPAVSTTLWKGMSLSAQWVFPLQNELGYEGDFMRPGLLALNQTVRLPSSTFLSGTAGYFTEHRYGADLEVKKFWRNGRWAAGANVGYTGQAVYLKGTWYWSDMDTWTGFLYGEHRFPEIDFTVKASYGSFIYRDKGCRFDVARQFGEVMAGFFGINTTRGRNGGFFFSVPVFPPKHLPPARIRISPASQIPWSYRYSGFTDYGIQYATGSSVDEFIRDFNPDFLQNQFMRHLTDTRGGK
jgi:hypothetical protein